MIDSYFYHSTLKNAIKLFGKLFSNLKVQKGDSYLEVPITYSKKDKIIQKYNQYIAGDAPHESTIALPRMGFIMGDPQIDKDRQLNRLNKIAPIQSKSRQYYSFNSIPYTVPFSLSIMAKNFDEILQLVEQIVPFFNPEFVVTIQDVPELELNTDYVFSLESISEELDTFDGAFDDRRLIVQTMSFNCQLNLYYPVMESKQIKKIILNGISDFEVEEDLFEYNLEVVPKEAEPDDVHILKESWQDHDNEPVVTLTSEPYEIFVSNLKGVIFSDYTDQQKFDEIWALIQDQLSIINDSNQLTSQVFFRMSNSIDLQVCSTYSNNEIIGYVPLKPLEVNAAFAPTRYSVSAQVA